VTQKIASQKSNHHKSPDFVSTRRHTYNTHDGKKARDNPKYQGNNHIDSWVIQGESYAGILTGQF
jgi:hypothetical protein